MAAPVRYRFSRRADGDFAVEGEPVALGERRRRLAPAPWTWLRQVHGAAVVTVSRPGEWAGALADASVTATPGAALSVQVADCAPVVLVGQGAAGPSIGIVHAGWRGLAAGVVGAAVEALQALGAERVDAVVGPHIGPECYEFGADELDDLAADLGPSVRGVTAGGRPALDLGAGIDVALGRAGVHAVEHAGGCTACDLEAYFSHRARGEAERLAAVAWLEGGDPR